MAKLTRDRDTKRREGAQFAFLAGEQIFCGAMVAMDTDGKLVAATADGKNAVGIAEEAGAAGDMIMVRRGVFNFVNDGDALTLADIGSECAIVDDQTVGKKGDSGAVAGILMDIDQFGAWVKI